MKNILIYTGSTIILMYVTWVFFTAVMRLRELRDSKVLTNRSNPIIWYLALITLAIGLIMDVVLDILISIPGLELPQWQNKEWLTTARLCRWFESTDTGWWMVHVRKPIAKFGGTLLNLIDTTGSHIH